MYWAVQTNIVSMGEQLQLTKIHKVENLAACDSSARPSIRGFPPTTGAAESGLRLRLPPSSPLSHNHASIGSSEPPTPPYLAL